MLLYANLAHTGFSKILSMANAALNISFLTANPICSNTKGAITNPTNHDEVYGVVLFTVDYSDEGSSISNVEFSIDFSLVYTDFSIPYSYS